MLDTILDTTWLPHRFLQIARWQLDLVNGRGNPGGITPQVSVSKDGCVQLPSKRGTKEVGQLADGTADTPGHVVGKADTCYRAQRCQVPND